MHPPREVTLELKKTIAVYATIQHKKRVTNIQVDRLE